MLAIKPANVPGLAGVTISGEKQGENMEGSMQ